MTAQNWQFFGTSVPGPKRPEGDIGQDAHIIHEVSPTQTLLVVCDGAGSRKHSAAGAQFCTDEAVKIFQPFGLHESRILTAENWFQFAEYGLFQLLERLKTHADNQDMPVQEFACTVQVLVIDESRLFHCHVGDGRAAFKIADQGWQPLMTPYRDPNQAGTTCFLTTSTVFADTPSTHIGCQVVEDERLEGLCLLTDGTEHLFFETVAESQENPGIFSPINVPFDPALDPLLDMLTPERKSADLSEFWTEYLTQDPKAIREIDDKTLVVGRRLLTKETTECSETKKAETSS